MRPSVFARIFPYCSIFCDANYEIVAEEIMQLLEETDDEWRLVSLDEYQKRYWGIRMPDSRKKRFFAVREYCISEQKAREFSPWWKER